MGNFLAIIANTAKIDPYNLWKSREKLKQNLAMDGQSNSVTETAVCLSFLQFVDPVRMGVRMSESARNGLKNDAL